MDEVCEVVITAPDAEWLAEFTHSLVVDRLAASGHIVTPIRSLYRWRSNIEDKPEARVALHTRSALVPAIIERTNRDHPYEVPCVVALPIAQANLEYARWIVAETQGPDR